MLLAAVRGDIADQALAAVAAGVLQAWDLEAVEASVEAVAEAVVVDGADRVADKGTEIIGAQNDIDTRELESLQTLSHCRCDRLHPCVRFRAFRCRAIHSDKDSRRGRGEVCEHHDL
jgi:hypothetical protein